MRPIQCTIAGVMSCALSAAAQVHQVAFELETPGLAELQIAIDNSVAASAERVIVATNWRLQIFSVAGGAPLDDRAVDASNFPFEPVDTTDAFPFFDPRVEYDRIHDCFWLMYVEKFPGSYVPVRDTIVAFPLYAGGSMLSGARPSEGDLRILNMLAVAPLGDDGDMHYAVQSPHEVKRSCRRSSKVQP